MHNWSYYLFYLINQLTNLTNYKWLLITNDIWFFWWRIRSDNIYSLIPVRCVSNWIKQSWSAFPILRTPLWPVSTRWRCLHANYVIHTSQRPFLYFLYFPRRPICCPFFQIFILLALFDLLFKSSRAPQKKTTFVALCLQPGAKCLHLASC